MEHQNRINENVPRNLSFFRDFAITEEIGAKAQGHSEDFAFQLKLRGELIPLFMVRRENSVLFRHLISVGEVDRYADGKEQAYFSKSHVFHERVSSAYDDLPTAHKAINLERESYRTPTCVGISLMIMRISITPNPAPISHFICDMVTSYEDAFLKPD